MAHPPRGTVEIQVAAKHPSTQLATRFDPAPQSVERDVSSSGMCAFRANTLLLSKSSRPRVTRVEQS
eukprot:scaffold34277_cov63-Phaeocystis_antarctica.AAC.5